MPLRLSLLAVAQLVLFACILFVRYRMKCLGIKGIFVGVVVPIIALGLFFRLGCKFGKKDINITITRSISRENCVCCVLWNNRAQHDKKSFSFLGSSLELNVSLMCLDIKDNCYYIEAASRNEKLLNSKESFRLMFFCM